MNASAENPTLPTEHAQQITELFGRIVEHDAPEAAAMLEPYPDPFIEEIIELLSPGLRQDVLAAFTPERRQLILASASLENRRQWLQNDAYPEGSIGRLMDAPLAVFAESTTIASATRTLRSLVPRAFVTYLWVVDADERFVGVVVMREMLLGRPEQTLAEIMIPDPFFLLPEMPTADAMRATLKKHFPVYPVCDADRRLVGTVRGAVLFAAEAFALSAQPGAMVGVEREERLSTHWMRSLKFRHPWLQLNLLTAFVAAAVVGFFEGTLERIVLLAVFLPVLAGQCGNTGCQALAVTLRGITLGELTRDKARALVRKEAVLGLCNGALVGLSAGLGMLVYATLQKRPDAPLLALITWVAMTGSCVISGIFGALVPLTLKRLGADPATASSIFLTTATDVVSMGTFLGLAALLV